MGSPLKQPLIPIPTPIFATTRGLEPPPTTKNRHQVLHLRAYTPATVCVNRDHQTDISPIAAKPVEVEGVQYPHTESQPSKHARSSHTDQNVLFFHPRGVVLHQMPFFEQRDGLVV